jgi:Spy/CpxP family protein refolding chaperone
VRYLELGLASLSEQTNHFQEELHMNRNLLAKSMAATAGLMCLIAGPALARVNKAPQGAALPSIQAPIAATAQAPSEARSKTAAITDDFAGLTYTDEQKAQIAKIHQDSDSKKAKVASAQTLDGDQKDAMILGYTRMEYGEIFKVLTPEQQKQVRKRMQSRKLADQEAQRKANPHK